MMTDQYLDPEILKTFGAYAHTFNLLDPTKVEPFFHTPSMLMTSKQVAVMQTSDDVLRVFNMLMERLRKLNFAKSEIQGSLKATQLSDNQGLVSGVAKRFDKEDQEIEHFGFSYTLRKVRDEWKIITGVIHDPETLS